ncbi:MAG: TRAP transporter substrate-binding protein [Casimicrobiaceae bacterium]
MEDVRCKTVSPHSAEVRKGSRCSVMAAAALTVFLACASPLVHADDLKLAHQFAPDSLPGKSAAYFANLVKQRSNGATTITVIPGGSLGDERANLQQLENGSLDLALTGDLVISLYAKPYILVSMPFLYRDPDHALNTMNGEIGQEIGKYLSEKNKLHLVAWQYVGTRELTANRPVRTLADLKGLKLRMPPAQMWVATWNKTGAAIANVAFTELQLALQTGTVNAQENPPNFIIANKLFEVQKYLILSDHYPQMQAFFIADAKYAAMKPEQRAMLEAAFQDTAKWTSEQAKAAQQTDIQWLTTKGKGGMELIKPDFAGIKDLVKDVPREMMGEDGPKLLARIQSVK